MTDAVARAKAAIDALQVDLNADARDYAPTGTDLLAEASYYLPRLTAADLGGGLAVAYYGQDYLGWARALERIMAPDIAPHIVELTIDGPDEGANGIQDWTFAPLLASGQRFPRLVELRLPISDTGAHNRALVTGEAAALVASMPALRRLQLSNPPEPDFFDIDLPNLASIRIGGAYETHDFIRHLAGATRLPALTFVDFTDSLGPLLSVEPSPAEWSSTPFADYEALFRSPVIERCWGIRLRNLALSESEVRALAAIRPELQFSVALDAPHIYVAHWDLGQFPHRHLLPFG